VKFIVDLQLSPLLCDVLRRLGHDAEHATTAGLKDDRDIWREAQARSAVVVSKDADFVELAERTRAAQVLHVAIGNCSNAELLRRFGAVWPELESSLRAGQAVVRLI
jgi:predicted nuclease of predicted toxin-antitoxin system